MDPVTTYIVDNHLGAYASVIGVFVAIIGFGITVWNVRKTKTAALAAQKAASKVSRDFQRLDIVSEFASAISCLEEIKRLHREGSWPILPGRYANLRKSLINIKGSSTDLDDQQKSKVQSCIQYTHRVEQAMEAHLQRKNDEFDVKGFNKIAAQQVDSLQELKISLINAIGTEHYEPTTNR